MRPWPKCSGPARLSSKCWQERLSVSYRIDQTRGKPRVLTFGPIACALASARNVTEGFRNRMRWYSWSASPVQSASWDPMDRQI